MNVRRLGPPAAGGNVLLEALISVAIFAIAMLGMIGLYAAFIEHSSEAEYRTTAAYLGNELISLIRSDNRAPDELKRQYEGSNGVGGAKYTNWVNGLKQEQRLPGVADVPPSVAVTVLDGVAPPDTAKARVDVTIRWQAPNTTSPHSHVLSTVISQ